jgi:tetratricopeptide (TPR) repeat protein
LNEAIKNYDLAINILKPLVEDEGRKELANDLASAYVNKGNALYSLGSLNEAIKNYDLAINIRKPLVEDEGRKELANDLAKALECKGNALSQQGELEDAVNFLSQAIAIYEENFENGRVELANDVARANGNKALALEQQKDWDAALVCYENALQGWAFCYEQSGMYWLMPTMLQFLRYRLMTLLDLNRWQDAAQDVSRFLELYTPFIENAEIHDGLKENATKERDAMIDSLRRLSEEEREEVYKHLSDEESAKIRGLINGE